jgi:hypothetical protein
MLAEMAFELNELLEVNLDEKAHRGRSGIGGPVLMAKLRELLKALVIRRVRPANNPVEATEEMSADDFMGSMGLSVKTNARVLARPALTGPAVEDEEEETGIDRRTGNASHELIASRVKEWCIRELADYMTIPAICSKASVFGTNPLTWWKIPSNANRFPLLARMARRYLAPRNNAGNQERIFSIAAKIYGKDRSRLSPVLLDALVFLFVNGELDTRMPKNLKP